MANEIENLKRKLQAIQKENKSLKQQSLDQEQQIVALEAVQRDYKLLQQETSSSLIQNRHSAAFWQDIEAKLKNDTDAIKSLIKNGTITMHDADQNGYTLLHSAAFWGNYEITQLCVNLQADLNYTNKYGLNALDTARRAKAHDTEQLLLFSEMEANIGDKIRNLSNNINKQNGLIQNILNELSLIGAQSKELFCKILTEIMINVINKKLVFSDNLLNLCWEIEKEKGNPLQSELWKALSKTCQTVIQNTSKKDWFWLKKCIIPSTIWYSDVSDVKEEKKDNDKESHSYLYYKLLAMVKMQSQKQLNELENVLKADASKDETAWKDLVKWDISKNKLTHLQQIPGSGSKPIEPRQDNIPNGIISEFTANQLDHDATDESFDGSKFYDYHQYLSKVALLAQIVDDEFQTSVQHIFNIDRYTNTAQLQFNTNMDEEKKHMEHDADILYQRGPVKLLHRAREKAENDYVDEAYPTSACLLDMNRCSLIFTQISSLLRALELFVNKVRSYQAGCIIGIVRCKNGFKDYVKRIQYADIKLNVLIRGKRNNIIGEIQFLLQSVVNFKSKAHNTYAIEREEEFISSSLSNILPSLLDQEKQLKIFAAMGDINGLCEIMLFNNKTEEDIMIIDRDKNTSILTPICERGAVDAFRYMAKLMDAQEMINHLFSDGKKAQTPIECAIRNNHKSVIEAIFQIDGVKKRYAESDEWKYRLIYRLFKNCNSVKSIEYVLKVMRFTDEKVVELMSYQYPTKGVSYYEDKIIVETVRKNKFNVLCKLSSIIGGTAFSERVFDVDCKDRNALEIAIGVNKLETIKYLLSYPQIKQKYNVKNINNDEVQRAIYRILYWLFVECKDENTIDFVLNTLGISREIIVKAVRYKYKKPAYAFDKHAVKYHSYSLISNDAINKLLNTLE